MFVIVIFLLSFTTLLVYYYNRTKHNYWASKGVRTPPITPFLGHISKNFSKKEYTWQYNDKAYYQFKEQKMLGLYDIHKPILLITDLNLLKQILIKDFEYFIDRRNFSFPSKQDEIINLMITNITGDHWKKVRSSLSLVFSSGKLKAMFSLVQAKANLFQNMCEEASASGDYVDMHDMAGRYALDVLASCVFGIEGDSLSKEYSHFHQLVKGTSRPGMQIYFKVLIYELSPQLFSLLRLTFSTATTEGLCNIVRETIRQRKQSGFIRGDFIDLMIEAMNKDESNVLTINTIIAQAYTFLRAGFETISNSLSYCMYHLAKYPEETNKLMQELNSLSITNDDISYFKVMDATYLDAFICETLRIFTPAHYIERQCTKKYVVANSNLVIEKGTIIQFPVWSVHHDAQYWDNPEEFKPSRFLSENKAKIEPYSYLPFGMGPRNCIGIRFAQFELKLALVKLILNFRLQLPKDHKLEFTPQPAVMRPAYGNMKFLLKPHKIIL